MTQSMITVRCDVHDEHSTVTVPSYELAEAVAPWFPEAPAEVVAALDELQDAVNRDDPRQYELAPFLGLFIERGRS